MATFLLGAREQGDVQVSDFAEFISIIKGRSIVSGADWGKDRVEFGLSGDLMLRIFLNHDEILIELVSTLNKGENPSLAIDLGDMDRKVPINVIIIKLNALRTLYAIFYLIYSGRGHDLELFLLSDPAGDIEQALLKEDEQLFIESVSYGSWILTVWGKTKETYQALVAVAGLVFDRGREAFLSKLEANARLKNAEADLKEREVNAKDFEIKKDQIDYLLEVSDSLDAPEIKAIIKDKIIEATKNLTFGDKSDGDSYKRLGP